VETRNQAEALVHGAEKAVEDLGDKADATAKAEVVAGVEALREALAGDDVEAISEKSAALSQSMMKMGEAAYNAEGDPADAESAAANNGDETVVDAEFEEVDADDDKKSKS
jgi:molecular chaperone DnaK